jgi:hypothetical protein
MLQRIAQSLYHTKPLWCRKAKPAQKLSHCLGISIGFFNVFRPVMFAWLKQFEDYASKTPELVPRCEGRTVQTNIEVVICCDCFITLVEGIMNPCNTEVD